MTLDVTLTLAISDRAVARIAVVDEEEQVVFDQYVKPTKPIVSYLTQLTGITERWVNYFVKSVTRLSGHV